MMMMQLDSPVSLRSVRAKEVSPVKSITYLVSRSNTRQLLKFLLLVASLSGPETFAPANNSTIAAAASEAAAARSPNREAVADRLSDWLLSERRSAGADLWAKQQLDSYPDTITAAATGNDLIIDDYRRSPCQLVPVMHVLHQAGCHAKAIDSFACVGSCSSYVQVSSSKFWQRERSCSCCQQTGLKEATFTLDCPSLTPPYRKVKTFAPVECLCRSCTDLNRENLQPQELVEAMMMNQQI